MIEKSRTPRAFVCGWPIKHSRSPLLHGFWLNEYEIDGSYEKIAVEPHKLSNLVEKIRTGVFVGGNVTLPHKEAVLKLVDRPDVAAKKICAVNTIYRIDNTIFGTNTDWTGFLENINASAPHWLEKDALNMRALIIGAGGAARAILYALIEKGFGQIDLVNRTKNRAEGLAREFGYAASKIRGLSFGDIESHAETYDLIVNTSSLGMNGQPSMDPSIFKLIPKLPPHAVINDIVYDPVETELLALARKNKLTAVDGLGMLLHQAVPGFEKWFGKKPVVSSALRQHILTDLQKDGS